jgi:hypothetical protein
MKNTIAVFEGHEIRHVYDEQTETWWFSVVDIIRVLTQQPDFTTARKYWNKLKERLAKEGSQLVTNCHQLKMPAADGKNYLTDAAPGTDAKPCRQPEVTSDEKTAEIKGRSVIRHVQAHVGPHSLHDRRRTEPDQAAGGPADGLADAA